MTGDDASRKRSLPEPLSHAMTVDAFPEFAKTTEYIAMVRIQLERMKAEAVDERARTDIVEQINDAFEGNDPLKKYDKAILILDFLELSVHNRHTTAGIETIKQKFLQDSGATRDAISKSAVVSGMGGK